MQKLLHFLQLIQVSTELQLDTNGTFVSGGLTRDQRMVVMIEPVWAGHLLAVVGQRVVQLLHIAAANSTK